MYSRLQRGNGEGIGTPFLFICSSVNKKKGEGVIKNAKFEVEMVLCQQRCITAIHVHTHAT